LNSFNFKKKVYYKVLTLESLMKKLFGTLLVFFLISCGGGGGSAAAASSSSGSSASGSGAAPTGSFAGQVDPVKATD
tara:strand:+ start:75 stop:305 length:231 start_codon:yes stop_codon:yes gene_type:complete